MTQPETLPLALDELRARLSDYLEDARKLFKEPDKRRLTILVRQPGEPERDCVVTDDTPEGVNEIVSRRLAPDKPEAEAVVAIRNELMAVHDALLEDSKDSQAMRDNYKLMNDKQIADNIERYKFAAMMLRRFNENIPAIVSKYIAPPLPSDKLRGLVRKWHREAECISYPDALNRAASELEALLSQEQGEAQKPIAWAVSYRGELANLCNTQDEAQHLADYRDKKYGDGEFRKVVPLFASPVTDGGGDVEACAREIVAQLIDSHPDTLRVVGADVEAIIRRHMGKP